MTDQHSSTASAQVCPGGIDPGFDECPKCGASMDSSCAFDYAGLVRELRATTPRVSGYAETANKAAHAIDALVKALEQCAAPYSTTPGSVNECAAQVHHEFQRRLDLAHAALSQVRP